MTEFVSTLVSNSADPQLSDALLSSIAQVLPDEARFVRLDRMIAVDIFFRTEQASAIEENIRQALGDAPVDVITQRADTRRKKLFLADMDSTMIGQECIDELAAEMGLKDHVAAITERSMRGELPFEPALRERVALLKGLDVNVISHIIQSRISITAGAQTLIATLRAHGVYTALVSGGFTAFTGPLAATIGFDENRANILQINKGQLTGFVDEPILGREAKRAALIELREQFALTQAETMAIGDGANDLAMIEESGLGVAWRAKPAVAAAADARLDHADLTALLYAQGYPKSVWMS